MRNILITGGAGFIGSHVFEKLSEVYPDSNIRVLDKMTYAADYENLFHVLERGKRSLTVGDVCDFKLCVEITKGVDAIFHLAAESHVDNSFGNSLEFSRSNTLGTHTLLEAARMNSVPLFVHVSTDEIYGEISEGSFKETDIPNPTNPYSASKASAEMVVNSYRHSFGMPIITVRANNIYGIRQFPEKIIPKFCMQMINGRKLTLHGNGENLRHYLSVKDFASALIVLVNKGQIGETYNIGSHEGYHNVEIAKMICNQFSISFEDSINYVDDRPFNDLRYDVDFSKMESLGWGRNHNLKDDLPKIAQWYRDNIHRYDSIEF